MENDKSFPAKAKKYVLEKEKLFPVWKGRFNWWKPLNFTVRKITHSWDLDLLHIVGNADYKM